MFAPHEKIKVWYTVAVLSLLYAVSIVDRLIMPMAVVDIRRSLGITDFEVSLMMGFAFALFYTMCGLPLGAAVDRYPRRWVIFAIALTLGTYRYTLLGIVAAQLILTPFVGYAAAAMQLITPPGMNGRMSAVFLFVISVFGLGLGLGPSVVAAITDFAFHSDAMLGRSLALFVIIAATCAALLLLLARPRFRAAIERARLHADYATPGKVRDIGGRQTTLR